MAVFRGLNKRTTYPKKAAHSLTTCSEHTLTVEVGWVKLGRAGRMVTELVARQQQQERRESPVGRMVLLVCQHCGYIQRAGTNFTPGFRRVFLLSARQRANDQIILNQNSLKAIRYRNYSFWEPLTPSVSAEHSTMDTHVGEIIRARHCLKAR